jgi:hypothetical protein
MSFATFASNTVAPTQFLQAGDTTYAYRRFGHDASLPLLCLQHFTGTLDNWDPAVTDPVADKEQFTGERFADLQSISQPALVVNGIHDEMIPVANSYRLVENLPNAMLVTYPDSGHGSLFQFHESFTRQASAFLLGDWP